MLNGSPPPSRLSGSASERLEAARGSMRDTLGAIRNLEQLLKSIRVGPKALATVIPDVHESCWPLRQALRELLGAIWGQLPDAARAVDAFAKPRVAEIESALSHARNATMNARERLALEEVVSRVARELDVARAMLELLEESLARATIRVNLLDLAREAFAGTDGRESQRGPRIRATLACSATGDVQANPRVAMRLIAIAVRLVAVSGPGTSPHVQAGQLGDGQVGVSISTGPGEGVVVSLAAPPAVGPLLECAQAAAQATHAHFEQSPNGSSICLFWSPAED
jgi:hypothetical protein